MKNCTIKCEEVSDSISAFDATESTLEKKDLLFHHYGEVIPFDGTKNDASKSKMRKYVGWMEEAGCDATEFFQNVYNSILRLQEARKGQKHLIYLVYQFYFRVSPMMSPEKDNILYKMRGSRVFIASRGDEEDEHGNGIIHFPLNGIENVDVDLNFCDTAEQVIGALQVERTLNE